MARETFSEAFLHVMAGACALGGTRYICPSCRREWNVLAYPKIVRGRHRTFLLADPTDTCPCHRTGVRM